MNIPSELLFGKTEAHLSPVPGSGARLHREVLPAFLELQQQAAKAGFRLAIASGFRSFNSQLTIWNQKASGQRPILDQNGTPLEVSKLSPAETVFSILRWSALPGASRHHWGTDFDVFDAAAITPGYQVQLTPQEVEGDGIFAKLHDWLDGEMATHGFFRPYAKDRGGVSPERWHLSFARLAEPYLNAYTEEVFSTLLADSEIKLIEAVRLEKAAIYSRYIHNVETAFGE